MGKYDIFKNKRNKHHPSIEIWIDINGNWFNYEITHSPKSGESYQLLNKDPNRLSVSNRPCFVRKYLRKDKLKHRGKKLNHYKLFPEDEFLINKMLIEREENIKNGKKKNGVKRLNQIGNQASHHSSEETPSAVIKSWTRRKRNRKRKEQK